MNAAMITADLIISAAICIGVCIGWLASRGRRTQLRRQVADRDTEIERLTARVAEFENVINIRRAQLARAARLGGLAKAEKRRDRSAAK